MLARMLQRFARTSGASGVAIGFRRKGKDLLNDGPHVITFFVRRKYPDPSHRGKLPNGRAVLPRRVKLDNQYIATDVVDQSGEIADAASHVTGKPIFAAGGPVSNLTASGTFGCLVRRKGSPFVHALTNQHVAIGVGQVVHFPSAGHAKAVHAAVTASVSVIPDEKFFSHINEPDAFVDVDAAIAAIPKAREGEFSPVTPKIGAFSGVFPSDASSVLDYAKLHIGLPVRAWSWRSGLRRGLIEYVSHYVVQTSGQIVMYNMLIGGIDEIPGIDMDSGKIWVEDGNAAVGLHQGILPRGGRNYAVATALAPIFRFLHLGLAT